jgi:aryl sulfotransferase
VKRSTSRHLPATSIGRLHRPAMVREAAGDKREQAPEVTYDNAQEDSGRWLGLQRRPGDIVISTPPKCGTTWLQMICALLIFQTPDLPEPLAGMSPWLDSKTKPVEEILAMLAAQDHRRFIKTHLPLDGLPLDDAVTYIVGARHPLDAAISLYYQFANIDMERLRQAFGISGPIDPLPDPPPPREWLAAYIGADVEPRSTPGSLQDTLHHFSDAWARRADVNIVLVHYDDLLTDLGGQMRRLAGVLGIAVPEAAWPRLVEAATFAGMRPQADRLVPAVPFKDNGAFFRVGRSGEGQSLLSDDELAAYHARAAELAPGDLLAWLDHR